MKKIRNITWRVHALSTDPDRVPTKADGQANVANTVADIRTLLKG
jgi:hypothetical protein